MTQSNCSLRGCYTFQPFCCPWKEKKKNLRLCWFPWLLLKELTTIFTPILSFVLFNTPLVEQEVGNLKILTELDPRSLLKTWFEQLDRNRSYSKTTANKLFLGLCANEPKSLALKQHFFWILSMQTWLVGLIVPKEQRNNLLAAIYEYSLWLWAYLKF